MTHEVLSNTPIETEEKRSPGQILRGIREFYGLSQEKLAQDAQITQGYLSQIETDNPDAKNPGYQKIIRLAKALGQGLRFLEGQSENRVFLTKQAIHLQDILESFPDDKKQMIERFIEETIPQPNYPAQTYIEIDEFQAPNELGSNIRKLRGQKPQWEIAKGAKFSQGHISTLESGDAEDPPFSTLERIATALGTSFEELIGIREIEVANAITLFDRYVRSEEIPTEAKKETFDRIATVLEFFTDPVLQGHFDLIPRSSFSGSMQD